MKIALSWLKSHIALSESPEEVAQLLTQIGLEVASVTPVNLVPGGLQGLCIGQVIACQQHPNADSLKITQVDIGADAPLAIVCGAPNVAAGQKVVVAPVGTLLYDKQGETFKIKRAKIRGEVSEGMLCAEDEIGLGDAHEGILVLDTPLPPGTPAVQCFDGCVDTVLDIDLTPNRGDACSHVGVARDLGALLDRPVTPPPYPRISDAVAPDISPIQVKVLAPEACPRYTGVTISGVQVQPSPTWMQDKLRAIGISPTNNIVDITNFVMHELGQPLHAFDYDQIAGHEVAVQYLPTGTAFTTLDHKARVLQGKELMICDRDGGLCMAGVLGGARSSVSEATQNIFLESAYFSPSVVRRAAKHHTISTDASFRYERGADPDITLKALQRACALIQEMAGGTAIAPIDLYPTPIAPPSVAVSYQRIQQVIGVAIPPAEIKQILTRLSINIRTEDGDNLVVQPPSYRTDLGREADIIEEVLRIYGYDRIPTGEHVGSTYMARGHESAHHRLQRAASEMMVASGYHEMCTNSLASDTYTGLTDAIDASASVPLVNPLSESLNVLRQTLLFSGLEVIRHNINRKQTDLKLFEFGKTYHQPATAQYQEHSRLGVWLTGHLATSHWMNKPTLVTFQDLNAILYKLLRKMGIQEEAFVQTTHGLYSACVQRVHKGTVLLTAGSVSPSLLKHFDIEQPVFFADIDWSALVDLYTPTHTYSPISKFPPVRRDLSLVLDKAVSFATIQAVIAKHNNRLIQEVNVFDVYEGKNIPADKKAYALRFTLQDRDKTLNEKTIDKVMTHLMRTFEDQLGAAIRQ